MYRIISYIFPISCMSCYSESAYCCRSCMIKSKPHPEICPMCHIYSPDYRFCSQCNNENIALDGIVIGFLFQWVVQRAIIALKYGHMFHIVDDLVDMLYYIFLTHRHLSHIYRNNPNNLMISFVPSHRTRKYLQKWYNQSELLALWLAKKLWIICYTAIQKLHWTKRQVWLTRIQRRNNLKGVYTLWSVIPSYITHIVIVDDVVSTWSTLLELAKTIHWIRPDISVRWLCIARK